MRALLPLLFLPLLLSGEDHAVRPLTALGEPAISPDGAEIAFVSGGDIWTVPAKGGEGRLLISDPATESRPLYSPDGSKLAFTSTRTGNGDLYVLTLAGGQLTRLTYSDSTELLDSWSPDGNWLYFASRQNDIASSTDIFRISAAGGTPLEVTRERFYSESRGAPSPNGTELAFVAKGMSAQWWRHGHSHLDETEIWVKGLSEAAPYRRIVEEDARQGWPMWSQDGNFLFYTSDRSGTENIFRVPCDEKSASKQLTHFTDGRLLWPSIGHDGHTIVFERNFTIWKMDTKSGVASEVPITLRGTVPTPAVTHQIITDFTDFALSPDGKKVAVIAHGDIFAASSKDGGEATRLTRTAAPESSLRWSPDSNRLVYASLRNGPSQIYEYDVAKNTERQITNSREDDDVPFISPDGKLLAFVRGDKELHVLSLDTNKDRILAAGFLEFAALAWSPDSKYIAFTEVGAKSFRNIDIAAVAEEQPHPVSFLGNGHTASRIAWSPDGKYLLFDTAQRTEPSQIARVDLTPHLPKFREDQFHELFKKDNSPGTPTDSAAKEPAPKPLVIASQPSEKKTPTQVVFDHIRERLTFMPLGFDSDEPVISPDGKTLVFAAVTGRQTNLYNYSLDELSTTPPSAHQLTSTPAPKSHYQFTPDSKELFFLEGSHIVSLMLESHAQKPLAVTAPFDIDFNADKRTAFEEAWHLLDERYYDPKFNGRDWQHLHDVYAPYIEGSKTPDEMARLTNLMIGELNSSHSGFNRRPGQGNPFSPAIIPVGRLGLRFEREPYESGKGLIVREVIPLGPAALENTVKPGETLLAVDNTPVGPHVNLDELLQNKIDHRVVLRIGTVGNPSQTREAIVRPISDGSETGLLYRSWVEANRSYVDRASGGRLGYVHVADMSAASLTQLYIDLDAQNQTRQGVVIDIRNNNGGFVNSYALDVFTRKDYLVMTPRGGTPAPARPYLGQRSLGLPTVLVVNQASLSDAEDFTEGYRALKLGKVVGEPTAGWIIYTGGAPLIDGAVVRLPMIRVQDEKGQNMEMHPRPVDVSVERLPGEGISGKDSQLDRAVQELLTQISAHPPK